MPRVVESECGEGRRPRKGKACHHSTHQLPTPNGICLSPDYKTLYVISIGKGPGDVGLGGDRNIYASTCKAPSANNRLFNTWR